MPTDILSDLQDILAEIVSTRQSHQALIDQGNKTMADAQAAYSAGQALVAAHSPMAEAYSTVVAHLNARIADRQATANTPVVEVASVEADPNTPVGGDS